MQEVCWILWDRIHRLMDPMNPGLFMGQHGEHGPYGQGSSTKVKHAIQIKPIIEGQPR